MHASKIHYANNRKAVIIQIRCDCGARSANLFGRCVTHTESWKIQPVFYHFSSILGIICIFVCNLLTALLIEMKADLLIS